MLFSCKAQCLPSGPRLNVQQSESQRANRSSPSEQRTIRPSDAKIPEAGLTLSSLICMFELISTLTPLHKRRPRSPFIDVVLSTLTSPHSSPWLWGNMGHNGSYLISSFPGHMRTCLPHVTWRFVGKYKVGTASLFNDPQPQPPPTLRLTSHHISQSGPNGVWEIFLMEPWHTQPVFSCTDLNAKHLSCYLSTLTFRNAMISF